MLEIWERGEQILCAATGYVEGRSVIARRVRSRFARPARAFFDNCWQQIEAVDTDAPLIALAAGVAEAYRLRALEAVHLAAAIQTGGELTFVTWDRELGEAARSAGFATAPA